jgi:hypothetical protein
MANLLGASASVFPVLAQCLLHSLLQNVLLT